MRRLWREFTAFAMSGSVFDLALGFLIGAALSKLIESFADNVLMQLVAAVFGQPDFHSWHFSVHRTYIYYGKFLNDLLSFFMLAGVLFLIIKMIRAMGVHGAQGREQRLCPYCLEAVIAHALVCKTCGQPLVAKLPGPEEAERRAREMLTRRLRIPPIPIPIPARVAQRRGTAAPDSQTAEDPDSGDTLLADDLLVAPERAPADETSD